ncbi:methyl-accepting chemotaxis protein [Striga asiatica]|uniref:Methyl-accepting chemotaxis protein n=1 Tax=Striga asiatica TaxID=4170 RepID=A0A5A7NW89_STRAF|nr:methyl-accepting chemotaxis protein [Striga asiatica]
MLSETAQPAAALDRAPPALSPPAISGLRQSRMSSGRTRLHYDDSRLLLVAGNWSLGRGGSHLVSVVGYRELFRFAGRGRGSSNRVGFQKLRLVDVDAPEGRSPVGGRGSPFTFSPENWGSRSRLVAFMAVGG